MLIENPDLVYTWKAMFMGFGGPQNLYPHYMYREDFDPLLVHSTDEEVEARRNGWDTITAAAMSNRYLINWFWDLEDFSSKQLLVFAKEEYGVDLPVEASQKTLFKAVIELTRNAPQNRNRLILMAHTVAMNYDATLEEIKRMMTPGAKGVASEIESFEVMM